MCYDNIDSRVMNSDNVRHTYKLLFNTISVTGCLMKVRDILITLASVNIFFGWDFNCHGPSKGAYDVAIPVVS